MYNLPPVWDNIIKRQVKAGRPRRVGGPHHHSLAQRPRQYHRDVLTDEADGRGKSSCELIFIILSIKCTKNCDISKPG